MQAQNDETLLRLFARGGDDSAFRELARRYGGLVYSACLRDVRRPELAEDAAQAVFLDLARKAPRIKVRTTLVPWLYSAARFASRNVLRAERRRSGREIPLDETIPSPDLSVDEALFQALDTLRSTDREAVVLRFAQGLSLSEVGQAQGVSEDAARMRIQRALKRLRAEYVPVLAAPLSFTARLATLALPKPAPIMTTPILLATGGVAALTICGVASAMGHKPTTNPSTQAVAAAPKPASLPATREKSVKPSASSPTIPTLEKPFTLVYRMTFRDIQTPAMKEAAIADRMKELAKEVDADKIRQADADAEIAAMRTPRAPRVKEITVSYDGHTLLFDEPSTGQKGDNPNVNLFDGRFSYHFTPGVKEMESQGQRCSGTVSHFTWNMPYIGPSLPLFPVVKNGMVLYLAAWEDKLHYAPAKVTRGPGGSVAKIDKDLVLSSFTKFQGRFVARSIVRTDWEFAGPFKGLPKFQMEYVLVSAEPTPLPADRFVPDTYLADGDDFSVVPKGPGDIVVPKFKFDRRKGNFAQQVTPFDKVGQ